MPDSTKGVLKGVGFSTDDVLARWLSGAELSKELVLSRLTTASKSKIGNMIKPLLQLSPKCSWIKGERGFSNCGTNGNFNNF